MSLNFRKSFGSTPSGTVSGGAVAQMVTIGIVDAHLTGGKADHSFFCTRMKTHNNFASETMSESFMGNVNWGHECSVTINKTPDLVTNVFAVIDRPGIYAVRNATGGSSGSSGWQRSSHGGSRPKKNSNYKRPPARGAPPGRNFPTTEQKQPQRRPVHTKRPPQRRRYEEDEEDHGAEEVPSELFWSEDEEDTLDEEGEGEADDAPYAHWVNSLGHAAIARTSISLAGMLGQMITGR